VRARRLPAATRCDGRIDHPGTHLSNTHPPPRPRGIADTHRRLFVSIFTPSALSATAQQAMGVLLPLFFLDVGLTPELAAAVFGLRGLGMVLFDVPAGMVVARLGDRRAMVVGLAGLGAVCSAAGATALPPLLAALMLLYGSSLSLYLLARLSFVSDAVPLDERGRVLAVLAGIQRFGALVGPLAAGVVADAIGFRATFEIVAVMLFAAAAVIALRAPAASGFAPGAGHAFERVGAILVAHRRAFATAGTCALVLMLMRATRTVIVPLFGASLGVSVGAIGGLVSVAACIDLILFYPAGEVMDRFGRRATLVPGMALMGAVFVGLAFADSFADLALAAVALGIANGWTTGVVMTIGTDIAPVEGRREFLGVWRLVADAGSMLGPFLVAGLIGVTGLGGAAAAVGAIGLAGALVALVAVPETGLTAPRS